MNDSKTHIMNKVRFMSEVGKKDVMTRRKAYASDDAIPLDDVIELYREVILFKRSYKKHFAGYALINHCYIIIHHYFFFFFNKKKKERNIFTLTNLIYMCIYIIICRETFQFEMESWFEPYIEKWLEVTNDKTLDWVNSAINIDEVNLFFFNNFS